MIAKQYHGSFSHKMQRLRTIYTQLERLQKEGVTPDPTIYGIVCDIDRVVQDLKGKTAP
jgi:hypothetical protein